MRLKKRFTRFPDKNLLVRDTTQKQGKDVVNPTEPSEPIPCVDYTRAKGGHNLTQPVGLQH